VKVLFLTTSFPRYEGDYSGTFVLNLAKQLKKNGIEVEVVAPNEKLLKKCEVIEGIPVHRFNYFIRKFQKLTYGGGGIPENLKRKKLLLILPFFLISFLLSSLKHSRRADLVQCLWFPIGILGVIIKLLYKKWLIVNVRGSDKIFLTRKFHFFSKIITNKSDALIAVAEELFKMIKMSKNRKVFFIPNGVDVSSKKKHEFMTNKKNILFVGNLSKNKSVDTLLKAIKYIDIKDRNDFAVAIIGDGPEKDYLESLAEYEGLEDKVFFLNALSQGEVFFLMERGYALVLPSLSEGRSNVILEAFASGLPVIASRVPANLEIVDDGNNGLLFKPQDSKELAEKITFLLNNQNIRNKLGEEGRKFIQKNELTWENTAKKYIKIYNNLLSGEMR
jgi:glycosyltransferase involved in cell wall biosynthesis